MPGIVGLSNESWENVRTALCVFLLLASRRRSFSRYLCLPIILAIFCIQLWTPPIRSKDLFQMLSEGRLMGVTLHHINLIFLAGVDLESNRTLSLIPRLKYVLLRYVLNIRGIGTIYQTKNVPPFPPYFRDGANLKKKFIVRQIVIGVWQYLLADVGIALLRALTEEERLTFYGSREEWIWLNGTATQWRLRFLATIVFWVTLKAILDLIYRFCSVFATATCITSMHEWPPLFGSITNAYTLRNLWGQWWHQLSRWPLSSYSNIITRQWLGLHRRSLLYRYLNNTLVFTLSGASHVIANWKVNVYDGDIGCLGFFLSFPLGYMLEDSAQHFWNIAKHRIMKSPGPAMCSKLHSILPYFEKTIGFAWVLGFLTFVTPWWIYPYLRIGGELALPCGFVELLGIHNVLIGIIGGAFVLYQVFEARP